MSDTDILLALDIDNSLMWSPNLYSFDDVTQHWIGGPHHWLLYFQDLREQVKQQGFNLQFAIVSSKGSFDDLVKEAVEQLQILFEDGLNPHTVCYDEPCLQYCLARVEVSDTDVDKHADYIIPTDLDLESDCHVKTRPHEYNEPVISIIPQGDTNKSRAIKRMAQAYDVPLDQCIMFDDIEAVHQDVANAGIPYVSTQSLASESLDSLPANLESLKSTLKNTIDHIIQQKKEQKVDEQLGHSVVNSIQNLQLFSLPNRNNWVTIDHTSSDLEHLKQRASSNLNYGN